MKELLIINADKLNVTEEKPIKKTKFLGRLKPHKGHICYQLDCTTGKISVAEIKSINTYLKGGVVKQVLVKENCIYAAALNIRNAKKHFLRMFKQ